MFNRKTLAAAGMTTVAMTAVLGGSLAVFTDTDTADPQVLTAGTIDIGLNEAADWNQGLTSLAVGDTAVRDVLVDNTSTLAIKSMRLTADVTDTPGEFGGNMSEAVTVDILQGATPLAEDVPMSDLAAGYDLAFPDTLAPATDVNLSFRYTVVGAPAAETGDRTGGDRSAADNPDNKYQGSAFNVVYTVDAIQRDGISQ